MIRNIQGLRFLSKLHDELIPNQFLGTKYIFIKWMPNGGLQFRINQSQQKSIPAEVLIIAYHIHTRNNRISSPVLTNQQWICANGYSDWCFVEVINYLLENHNIN
jgi:hypothetical protein